jgi:hypothetical protein
VVINEERCPTCMGNGYIVREHRSWPCPTCSPAISTAAIQYLHADDKIESSALARLRRAAFFVGAFGIVLALALLAVALWH